MVRRIHRESVKRQSYCSVDNLIQTTLDKYFKFKSKKTYSDETKMQMPNMSQGSPYCSTKKDKQKFTQIVGLTCTDTNLDSEAKNKLFLEKINTVRNESLNSEKERNESFCFSESEHSTSAFSTTQHMDEPEVISDSDAPDYNLSSFNNRTLNRKNFPQAQNCGISDQQDSTDSDRTHFSLSPKAGPSNDKAAHTSVVTSITQNGSDQVQPKTAKMKSSQCRSFTSKKTGLNSSPIVKIPIEFELYETNSEQSNLVSPSRTINLISIEVLKPLEGNSTISVLKTPVKRKVTNGDAELKRQSSNMYTPTKRKMLSPQKSLCLSPSSNVSSPGRSSKGSPRKVSKNKLSPKQLKFEGKSLYRLTHVKELLKMIRTALERPAYQQLFSGAEKGVLKEFCKLREKSQYFIFKLFLYLPKWYNIYDICRKIEIGLEDPDIKSMYEQLDTLKMIDLNYHTENVTTLMNLLQRGDLKDICNSFRIKMQNYTRDKMVQELLKNCTVEPSLKIQGIKTKFEILVHRVKQKLGYCVKLHDDFKEILRKVYLLHTFANRDFLKPQEYFYRVIDLSAVFPSYKVESDFRLFYSQEDFQRYAKTQALKCNLLDALDKKNDKTLELALEFGKMAFEDLKALSISDSNNSFHEKYPHLKYFTAKYQYVSILNTASQYLISKDHLAVKRWLVYLLGQKEFEEKFAGWYHQMAIIFENHLRMYDYAARFLIKGLRCKSCISEIELEDIALRGRRLKDAVTHKIAKKYHDKLVVYLPTPPDTPEFPSCFISAKAIRSNTPGRKRHYVVSTDNGDKEFISVENIALNYYKEQNYPCGIHCEGSLASALFCLLFYDLIYEIYIPGTFLLEIQTCPLDFYTKYFYKNREAIISERLKNIYSQWTDEELREFLIDKYNKHSHESFNSSIESFSCGLLLSIISCIGRPVLSKILERLVTNYKVYRSGMPDLLVWNVEEKTYKFVEVKGEHDKLSTKQKFWLKYLRSINADIEVCHVNPIGSKMKKPKKSKI